ncbi:MAG: flagellar M-ring protein FliF [Rhodothermales bacterium]|jgi:flagellar M-ring protein FliF
MNGFFQQFQAFILRLPVQQRLVIGGVLVGGVLALSSIAYWANQPDYAMLFTNLSQKDAGQVIENLQGRGVTYELRGNGSSVYVPREDVYELRISMATNGVISDGPVTYEGIFGGGTLGMTQAMWSLNAKRGLEGELARSINSLRQIETTRVHLVTPVRSPFRETQVEPSASVIVELAAGASLTHAQIDGIASLVAGAVEGLQAGDVTIVDTKSNVLSTGGEEDTEVMLSSTQLQIQRAVEDGLVAKSQEMLDKALGVGNSIVQVSASLDFSRTISNRELIDPESATVVSEEKIDERMSPDAEANSQVRNYELSRTTETHEKGIGTIESLTVAVILNQKVQPAAPAADDADDALPVFVAYTGAELAEFENIVKNAIGFNANRGDQLALHQTHFEPLAADPLLEEMRAVDKSDRIAMYLRYGLIALALAFAFLLVRKAGKQVTEMRDPSPAGRLDGGGRYDAGARVLGAGERHAIGSNVFPGRSLTAAEGGAGGRSLDQRMTAGLGPEEAAILAADRQLTAAADAAAADLYAEKLELEARASRSEDPVFALVRKMVDASPEDAASVIRTWLTKDGMAI